MKKFAIIIAAAVAALVSCGPKKSADECKALVLYYSQTTTTRTVAELIQQKTGADIAEITVVNPYGDYNQTIERGRQEVVSESLPELNPLSVNIADYDVIYLGYPIWFGTVANPILSLLENEDFAGKTVVPFCTFGSGGSKTSLAYLKSKLTKANLLDACYGVRQARIKKASAELDRFLVERGLIEGEVVALPDYTELRPCTEEEASIFYQAISTYPMLDGTQPIAAGARVTPEGTDYCFSAGPVESPMHILVTVSNEEGSVPEFTEVLR